MEIIQNFFTSLWHAVTLLELVGFVTAILYSLLASYEKVWCWPFALISSAIIAYVNIRLHYTMQSALQIFYFAMAVYGWYAWVYDKRDAAPLHVISYAPQKMLMVLLAGIPPTIILALVGQHYFQVDKPWLDAGLTIYAIIATWMMTRKVIQNWLLWIVVDPLSILLYAPRERYLISLLFFIYTVVAIFGYFKWRQQLKTQSAHA